MRASLLVALLLAAVLVESAYAGSEQGAVSSSVGFQRILRGYLDPIDVQIYNTAPAGSDAFNYSVFASSPAGNSAALTGSRAADGGVGFDSKQFFYDSTNATLGPN